ncbi:MAG: trypsin-like peptidase domain-containing protein [Balneolaceae bacterium]|jgi:Do/DeqQ family serine protease
MKKRDRYLSGILLVLIGILIGMSFVVYQQQNAANDLADVKVTEVNHSSTPLFSNKDLEKLDDRFLFKKIAEHVTPTVVYIETVISLSESDMPDDEYHNKRDDGFWGNLFPRRARTVGSGILISKDGYILTNNHVIEGAIDGEIEVVLNDKRTFRGRIVGADPTTDLAVLKIDAVGLPAITVGNSDRVEVGEWVLAIGNPFRLRSTVTAGIVSALSRDVQIINNSRRVESFIQTDAAINKGNSGGALVNTSGELIGVNTAIASQSGSYQGYGFAIPSNLAYKVAEDIIQYGEVRRALLGVTIVSVNSILAKELNMEKIEGVEITAIQPGGAADKYGLQPKDVIISVNGNEVNESNQLQEKIAVLRPGEIVTLQILRAGKLLTKKIELGELEPSQRLAFSNDASDEDDMNPDGNSELRAVDFATFELGFRVMALSKTDKPGSFDIVITDVIKGSEAEKKGLEEGFSIRKVDNQKVEDLQSMKDLIAQNLKKNKSVTFEVETREGAIELFNLEQ